MGVWHGSLLVCMCSKVSELRFKMWLSRHNHSAAALHCAGEDATLGQGTLGMEGVGAPGGGGTQVSTLDLAAAPEEDEQVRRFGTILTPGWRNKWPTNDSLLFCRCHCLATALPHGGSCYT